MILFAVIDMFFATSKHEYVYGSLRFNVKELYEKEI